MTVPESLFVIKVPEVLGKSIVLSAVVGSTTPKVVSYASTVEPSKTSVAVLLNKTFPVTVPPASANFSVSNY